MFKGKQAKANNLYSTSRKVIWIAGGPFKWKVPLYFSITQFAGGPLDSPIHVSGQLWPFQDIFGSSSSGHACWARKIGSISKSWISDDGPTTLILAFFIRAGEARVKRGGILSITLLHSRLCAPQSGCFLRWEYGICTSFSLTVHYVDHVHILKLNGLQIPPYSSA